jgi:hypothetical protein
MKLGSMEIDLPGEWEDRSMYTFIAPAKKAGVGPTAKAAPEFRTNVVITPSPLESGVDLKACSRRVEERIRRDFGDVEIAADDGPSAGGRKSRRLKYRVVNPRGGAPIEQVQYVIIAGGREWNITFSTISLEAKALEPAFEQYIRSIRFDREG